MICQTCNKEIKKDVVMDDHGNIRPIGKCDCND